MSVPDFQTMMLPFLQFADDGQEHSVGDVTEYLAQTFALTNEDKQELIPSGRQTKLKNRVSWVCAHFKKAGLIEYTKRGHFQITNRGINLLNKNLNRVDIKVLDQFSEYQFFRSSKNIKNEQNNADETILDKTPEEVLETAFLAIKNNLATEILQTIKSCSPAFFERLVIDLLVKMGYGGTLRDAGRAIGRSGDGGIDGIIKEDRLGLDVIYLQAKRWEGNVSRPEVQKFAGALQGQRARKGVFITTSDFTKEARDFAAMIDSKIILISGDELAQLMIDYNVGVSNAAVYEIKRIDSDYFTEE